MTKGPMDKALMAKVPMVKAPMAVASPMAVRKRRSAAATAAGMVGGSLLLNGIRSMMGGGQHHAFGDTSVSQDRAASPLNDQSNSSLARDAGINDIGLAHDNADDGRRTGLLDQASNDDDNRGDMDLDSDDFGADNDGGSDYA